MRRGLLALVAAAGLVLVAAGAAGVARWRPARTSGAARPAHRVAVAAAADLRFALDELVAQFRRQRPDVDVSVSYGSSGTFFAQISNGAPFDLFLSADRSYPDQLAARGLTRAGSGFTYAVGRIVLWVPAGSPIDVMGLGFAALDDDRMHHVAIANPEHAPYGRAAVAALASAGRLDRVKSRLVFGENISQTLQFVQSGAADAGIVALSLAVAPTIKDKGRFWEIPRDLYPTLEQGGVILRTAADPAAAEDLRRFIVSPDARTTLARYGFAPPRT